LRMIDHLQVLHNPLRTAKSESHLSLRRIETADGPRAASQRSTDEL
jgi:hypothetical protein